MLVSIKPADVRMMANDSCSTRATSSAPTRYPPAYTTTSAPRDEARVAPANVAIATPRRVPANTMAVDTLVVDTSRCARNVTRYGGLRAQREGSSVVTSQFSYGWIPAAGFANNLLYNAVSLGEHSISRISNFGDCRRSDRIRAVHGFV